MPSTAPLPLVANRWEPFVYEIRIEGLDLTNATFVAQVRRTRDTSEAPFADLSTVASVRTEGITIVSVGNENIDFGGEAGVVNVPVTTISMRINETTVENMPKPDEIGEDVSYYWDGQVTPSGGTKYRFAEGPFVVHAGVTH